MLTATRIALIVGLVVVLVIVRSVLRYLKVFKIIRRKNKTAANLAGMSSRINLELEPNPQWHNSKVINEYADQLKALGFEDAGAYSIPELGGLMILGLVHP